MSAPTDEPLVTFTAPDAASAAGPAPNGSAPAGAESPLGSLRARRAKLAEKLYLDLKVPRWDHDGGPAIYVRYRPADAAEFTDKAEKARKNAKKKPDWAIPVNADMLVKACIGVYAVEGDPPDDGDEDTRPKLSLRDGDPHGTWTRFDLDLADSLGLTGGESADPNARPSAVLVCRHLYFTDGDLVGAANDLLRWSGVVRLEDREDFTVG